MYPGNLTLEDFAIQQLYDCRFKCEESGRRYYSNDIIDPATGYYIEKFVPDDGLDYDTSSTNIFKEEPGIHDYLALKEYKDNIESLLGFYDRIGTLVDYEPRKGYDSYDEIKRTLQHNIKH